MLAILFEESCELSAAFTVSAKIVPECTILTIYITGKFLDACQDGAVIIIIPTTVFPDPAIFIVFLQCERIGETCDAVCKVCAIVV